MQPRQISTGAYVAIVGGPPSSFTDLRLESGHIALVGLLAAKTNLHRRICRHCGGPTIFLHRLES